MKGPLSGWLPQSSLIKFKGIIEAKGLSKGPTPQVIGSKNKFMITPRFYFASQFNNVLRLVDIFRFSFVLLWIFITDFRFIIRQ